MAKSLICCCCGERAYGKQWWNRDKGFGLCVRCIPIVNRGISEQEMESNYGKRGVHYDVADPAVIEAR